jgi:hypothetical protein
MNSLTMDDFTFYGNAVQYNLGDAPRGEANVLAQRLYVLEHMVNTPEFPDLKPSNLDESAGDLDIQSRYAAKCPCLCDTMSCVYLDMDIWQGQDGGEFIEVVLGYYYNDQPFPGHQCSILSS